MSAALRFCGSVVVASTVLVLAATVVLWPLVLFAEPYVTPWWAVTLYLGQATALSFLTVWCLARRYLSWPG